MALLDDILAWSQAALKPWQQDAIRRLFQNQMDAASIEDLYAMLKASHGIPDPQNRVPNPLGKQHIPATATGPSTATLVAIREVSNVNRLAPKQVLPFSRKGMTIIYGGNGSGKSGYARILKRACRSRDTKEEVRPNATDRTQANVIPQATIDIELSGLPMSIDWAANKPAPDELSTVAVFDSRCARVFLDEQQEMAYIPFGLDVVEDLAQVVVPTLLAKLKTEADSVSVSKDHLAELHGATKVGELIQKLDANTAEDQVRNLADLSDAEIARLKELEETLGEADPKAKAKVLDLRLKRVQSLLKHIDNVAAQFSNQIFADSQKLDQQTEAAIVAESQAAIALQSGESLLPATGQPIWKALYEAAREFSVNEAYRGHDFPHTGSDARCVLCQQSLSAEAGARLLRFEAYVRENVARHASDRSSERKSAIQAIVDASASVHVDETLREELDALDASAMDEIKKLNEQLEARKRWLVEAFAAHSWSSAPAITADPWNRLQIIVTQLTTEINGYIAAADETKQEALKRELAELKSRHNLARRIEEVLKLIQAMRTRAALEKCKEDLKTKRISDTAKEFASNAVTAPLRANLQREFSRAQVSSLLPNLAESVERGKMRHKLELELAYAAQVRDILSEGEQRAIAIASFLAELNTSGHGGAIVFDDPVCSLDHFRRRNIAIRLVEEAALRQVVVFTHDTSFLGELRDLLQTAGIYHLIHHLEWVGPHSGTVREGLPWHHKSYKERIDALEKAQSAMSKNWPLYPDEQHSAAMRTQYSRFRATIERVVQDLVFNGVVRRYRDWIRVSDLTGVVGFCEAECSELLRLHQKASDVIDGHDPSSGKNATVPDPVEFRADIAALNALAKAITTRREGSKRATTTV